MSVAEVKLTKGQVALVDEADLPQVLPYSWDALWDGSTWYARRHVYRADGTRTRQQLHTFLTGLPYVDHVDGNGLNNCRANLRPATHGQNMWNRRKRKGVSSQFKGVHFHKARRLWVGRIKPNRQEFWLGYFTDEMDAALAYDQAARVHYGEFAALNFPRPGERSALTGLVVPIDAITNGESR